MRSLPHFPILYSYFFFFTGYPWCWSLLWYCHRIRVRNSPRTWPNCSLFLYLQVRHIYFALEMAFESDFVVCRLGSAQDLAKTFAKWQSFVSIPNLDRKLASTLTVTPAGIVIAGAISFCCCPCKNSKKNHKSFTQVLILVLVPNMTRIPSTLKLNWAPDL